MTVHQFFCILHLSCYLVLLNANFYYDVSVANDAAIDVANCALLSKVMHFKQWKSAMHNEIK